VRRLRNPKDVDAGHRRRKHSDVTGLQGPLIAFGDKASIGLFSALIERSYPHPIRHLIEADAAQALASVLARGGSLAPLCMSANPTTVAST
jgi:hypothetical protein